MGSPGRLGAIARATREGRLRSAVSSRARLLSYAIRDPAGGRVELHCPEFVEPSREAAEGEIVDRVFRAYHAMVEYRSGIDEFYQPASLWQQTLDADYWPLASAIEKSDQNVFHHFLANFGAWKTNLGVENVALIRENNRSVLRRRYLQHQVFLNQVQTWRWYYNDRNPLELLSYPRHGNQSGALVDGVFVGVGSVGVEIHGALISNLINDIDRPVLADLGAGYGKFDYFCLRDHELFCFIDFDLPETLCLAAYYMMMTWPEKKTLLFGEADFGPDSHERYDLIFMPSWEIEQLGDGTVDVFLNKNSLGEMSAAAASNYVHHISRSTRFFYHMNHDNYPNVYSGADRGLLAHEYPIPADSFRLVHRGVDLIHMLHRGGLNFGMDIFCYLYERKT